MLRVRSIGKGVTGTALFLSNCPTMYSVGGKEGRTKWEGGRRARRSTRPEPEHPGAGAKERPGLLWELARVDQEPAGKRQVPAPGNARAAPRFSARRTRAARGAIGFLRGSRELPRRGRPRAWRRRR